ncbi:UNVERIFIED_CONTAM: hypothetical protein H355_001722 [Colinus virginianus]|nr:hypothetical protein H355_001722 [Colinus virginianus]
MTAAAPVSNSRNLQRGGSEMPRIDRKVTRLRRVDAFIEQAIVRCALSENFVFYSGDTYDRLEGAPRWAQESLRQHEKDPRVPLYDMRVLEAAETYDALWNAAQLQLMREGKMHGYLRMYWAKKMLEWMKSPADALAGAIYLNDKYSLDGTDPNGYVGCMWSIAALHDQPFKERPIFGKVRYMTFAGCQRKFNVRAFLELYKSSNSTSSISSGTTITRKRRKGSGIREDSESATRKGKKRGSRGRGDALGTEAKKKAEKGAERLGKELLTNIIQEQRQQQEEAPAGHEEGSAEKHELDAPPKENAVKRQQPIKEEDKDERKPQQLQKHEKERRKGTLHATLGEKHSERRPKGRTKTKQRQA